MKIDRLIGIITVLLQKEKVTAPYLAQKFEVSRRTINRDIEAICAAGIPVVTLQGSNGGIMIAEGYKMNHTMLNAEEVRAISAGLCSLDSVEQGGKYRSMLAKLCAGGDKKTAQNQISIDLASHYKASLAPKISALQTAIDTLHTVRFTYYSGAGEREVTLEPYRLVFRWSSWYVFGYDTAKQDFRLFKLNRLNALQATAVSFVTKAIPDETQDFDRCFTNEINAVIHFDASVKYKLVEEYGANSFAVLPDGKLRLAVPFTNKEYLLEWVLSFGEKAELIQPAELREALSQNLHAALKQYLQ